MSRSGAVSVSPIFSIVSMTRVRHSTTLFDRPLPYPLVMFYLRRGFPLAMVTYDTGAGVYAPAVMP